jgi:hypothetical protein
MYVCVEKSHGSILVPGALTTRHCHCNGWFEWGAQCGTCRSGPHTILHLGLTMHLRMAVLGALCSACLLPNVARARDAAASVVGVWKVIDVQTVEAVSGKAVRPFGEHPTGTFVFTRGGHMAGMQFAFNRKAAAGPNATETERAALFSSMTACSGTHCVEGNRLIISVDDSSIQSWNGTQRILNIDIDGAPLTGTSEVFRSLITGLDGVGVITWETIE